MKPKHSKNIKSIFLIVFLFSISAFQKSFSQIKQAKYVITPGLKGSYPKSIDFEMENAPAFIEGKVPMIDNGQLNYLNDMKFFNFNEDQNGQKHYRYQQTYMGIPIENAIVAMHVQNGKVYKINGQLIKGLPDKKNLQASISPEKALEYALQATKAEQYAWQDDNMEKQLKTIKDDFKATYFPKSELVWYSVDDSLTLSSLHLAYCLNIYALKPFSNNLIYIDAINGQLLGKSNLVYPSKAYTVYSGLKDITTSTYQGLHVLKDITRGKGIGTYNALNESKGSVTHFADQDDIWFNNNDKFPAIDQYGADAHWGAEQCYDYYKNKFNRNSMDNKGIMINNYVNTTVGFEDLLQSANSYYIPGTGGIHYNIAPTYNNKTYPPSTSLQTVAHEYTHGIIYYTSNLIRNYDDKESAGVNEGLCEVMSMLIKHEADGNSNDWYYFSKPNLYGLPKYYRGKYWATSKTSWETAETNAAVLTYWYYLLSHGDSSSNEKGELHFIKGIGDQSASSIIYNANTYYLTPTSNFGDMRSATVDAAEALFGKGSKEVIDVKKAWQAVGFGDPIECTYKNNNGIIVCAGTQMSVNYDSYTLFNQGNVFTLYLSDKNGNFDNKKAIGWLGSTNNKGLIVGFLSSSTPPGFYQIRVESSDPKFEYTTSTYFFINSNPLRSIKASSPFICKADAGVSVLSAKADFVSSWLWSTGATTSTIEVNEPGEYGVSIKDIDGCIFPEKKIILKDSCPFSVYMLDPRKYQPIPNPLPKNRDAFKLPVNLWVILKNWNATLDNLRIGWSINGEIQEPYVIKQDNFSSATTINIPANLGIINAEPGKEYKIQAWLINDYPAADSNGNDVATIVYRTPDCLIDLPFVEKLTEMLKNNSSLGSYFKLPINTRLVNNAQEGAIKNAVVHWQVCVADAGAVENPNCKAEPQPEHIWDGIIEAGSASDIFDLGNIDIEPNKNYTLKVWTTEVINTDGTIGNNDEVIYQFSTIHDINNYSDRLLKDDNVLSNASLAIVSPNPMKSEAVVSIKLTQKELLKSKTQYKLSLFEANGRKVAEYFMNNNGTSFQTKIKKGNLAAGNYYFEISSNNKPHIRRGKIVIE